MIRLLSCMPLFSGLSHHVQKVTGCGGETWQPSRRLAWPLLVLSLFVMGGAQPDRAADDDLASAYIVVELATGEVTGLDQLANPAMADQRFKTTHMLLRRIPAGTFMMGSPQSELGRRDNETLHEVTLSRPFYMAVFPCTQAQYEAVMGSNPSSVVGAIHPVERVSWFVVRGGQWPDGDPDADAFMGRLRARTGCAFDLPTEAQWEYAARAGSSTAYHDHRDALTDGEDEDPNLSPLAWYRANTPDNQHQPVGGRQPNAWGLYDMLGNIREWCLDYYVDDRGHEPVTDPVGPEALESPRGYRVLRGGCWFNRARDCRLASRVADSPGHSYAYYGFRVCLPAE